MMNNRLLIESDSFSEIVRIVNDEAPNEKKQQTRPDYWNMVFWWTRKPLVVARAFVAAALLPESYDISKFKYNIRLPLDKNKSSKKKSKNSEPPHRHNPLFKDEFKDFTLLDPFAGFGSIPLEAQRLGVGKVIASDLLPVATFFLKAILEYPKYGKQLIEDVKKYGYVLLERIKDYASKWYDANGFVGTWEVKCPYCKNYTPLIRKWWLQELKDQRKDAKPGTFRRLVYMRPDPENRDGRIVVRDLNKELGKESIKAETTENSVKVDGREYDHWAPPNVDAQRDKAKCLICNFELPKEEGEKWYVKEAIKDWNDKYGKYINGEISLDELRNSMARPKLLVKFFGDSKFELRFEEITQQDEEKFWKAFEELRRIEISLIPTEELPPYENRSMWVISWGIDKFFKLFNPRQLLVIIHAMEIIKQLKKEIKGDEEYKNAVLAYLTIMLLNYVRHNTLVTSIEPTSKFITHSFAERGLALTWNWVDISPLNDLTGSLKKSLEHVIKGLEYLVNAHNTASKIEILNKDVLDMDLEKVDAIVTDPPYADDVPYPELSDFYYVWIKRIFPTLYPYETQWKEFAPKDLGVDDGRKNYFHDNVGTKDYSRERMALAFEKLYSLLKDDGVLVTFYNHTSPVAWASLLYAGWYRAKFRVSATYATTTEDPNRTTSRNTSKSLNKSIVIVWRKRAEGEKDIMDVKDEALQKVSDWVAKRIDNKSGEKPLEFTLDTFIEVMGKVLEVFTKYEKLSRLERVCNKTGAEAVECLVEKFVFPTTAASIVKGIVKGVSQKAEEKGIKVKVEDEVSSYYLLVKLLFPPKKNGRRSLEKSDQTIFEFISGAGRKKLEDSGIIEIDKSSRKDKGSEITLVEPTGSNELEIMSSLEEMEHVKRALNGDYEFKNPVQVLHYLEYVSLKEPSNLKTVMEKLKREKGEYLEEALSLAKIFTFVLTDDDPEKMLAERIVGRERVGIERFFG